MVVSLSELESDRREELIEKLVSLNRHISNLISIEYNRTNFNYAEKDSIFVDEKSGEFLLTLNEEYGGSGNVFCIIKEKLI